MLNKINETVTYLRDKTGFRPDVGIILGTGLGGLVKEIKIEYELEYDSIPNFPIPTVDGHHGKLIMGELENRKVMAMQGRFHYYEGFSMQDIVFPVRVMKFLGIRYLFLSNASGGVNPDFDIGDLMIMTDHINLLPNPLIGPHIPEYGERFPDMSETYSKELIQEAENIAQRHGIKIRKGVYTATSGPTFETPAEYQYFRIIGSDTVGMSTVPETIVARQMGIPCFAISIITDLGIPGKIEMVTHELVQEVAHRAEEKMTLLMRNLIGTL
jgi:purine-nucleoside phosphorylase